VFKSDIARIAQSNKKNNGTKQGKATSVDEEVNQGIIDIIP
jgi:hypothetical protein